MKASFLNSRIVYSLTYSYLCEPKRVVYPNLGSNKLKETEL